MRRRTLLAAVLVLLTFGPSAVLASSPSLTGVRPVGGQRGTEMEINFHGDRMSDAKEILFYQPGITVTKLVAVNNTHVKASVKIAADCPPRPPRPPAPDGDGPERVADFLRRCLEGRGRGRAEQ